MHEKTVKFHPVIHVGCLADELGYAGEFLPVIVPCLRRNKLVGVKVFLYGQKYLFRIDRFYEVVGDFVADCLIHDIFFLAFGNHYHRNVGRYELDALQCLKSRQSGHVFIEDDEVEVLFVDECKSVSTAAGGDNLVALPFEEHYVGF